MVSDGSELVRAIAAGAGLTAGAFIVTLFGDVVEPRGGRVATGSIIEACERVGLNATQVRTALSRLVAAGRLEGTREGRRSHYRLAEAAREEFRAASQAIFAPERPSGWLFIWSTTEAGFEASGARRIGPEFWLAPTDATAPEALTFSAAALGPPRLVQQLARKLWPLDACEASYAAFEELFAPLEAAASRVAGETALTLRLLLTHRFRAAALQDPLLPRSALPERWRGDTGRRLFTTLYLALSPAADAAVPELFSDGESSLAAKTADTSAREADLRRRPKGPPRP
jgi:phenylacetic acid degradation operon negative regulatory protein